MGASQSMLSQLGIDTASPVTKRFNFQEGDFGFLESLVDGNGLRGTLSHANENVRAGNRACQGWFRAQPTPLEWTLLLPWITGGAQSGAGTSASPYVFPLADHAPTAEYVVCDMLAKVFTASGCQVDQAIITGAQGAPVLLEVHYVGVDATGGNSGTFPALSLDLTAPPFLFTDLAYTWGGTAYKVKNFRLTIDFGIDKERYFNSQTLLSAERTDCKVSVESDFGFGDATALYAAGSTAGVHAIATFTNGVNVLKADMGCVRFPQKTPTVPNRAEILLPIQGQAFMSGTTKELIFNLQNAA